MNTHYMHGNKAGIMFALLTILGCIVCSTPVRADIYFWTDSGGVIHFSNHNPPPEAQFFMVEQPADENPVHETTAAPVLSKRDPLQDQLTEANRKLEKALDKVDDLTEKVEQTRRDARNAADAAQRAQAEAKIANESRTERTVVYAVPYRHRPQRPRPEPYYWKHDTSKYPYYQGNRHRTHRRPENKPEQYQPRNSGISIKSSRNGTHIQGSVGLSSGR